MIPVVFVVHIWITVSRIDNEVWMSPLWSVCVCPIPFLLNFWYRNDRPWEHCSVVFNMFQSESEALNQWIIFLQPDYCFTKLTQHWFSRHCILLSMTQQECS